MFRSAFAGTTGRTYIEEIRSVRNKWAHQESFEEDEVSRALDTIARFLKLVEAIPNARAVEQLRQEVGTPPSRPHQPADHQRFHELAGEPFSRHFGIKFDLNQPIAIGVPPNPHSALPGNAFSELSARADSSPR